MSAADPNHVALAPPESAAIERRSSTILHVEWAATFGGSVRCLHNFLAHTSDTSLRHVVCLYSPLHERDLLAKHSDGVYVAPSLPGPLRVGTPSRIAQLLRDLWITQWLYRLIRRQDVALVRLNNSPLVHRPALFAAAIARVPCVAWLRSFPVDGATIERRWKRSIVRYVAVSDAVRTAYVAAGLPSQQIATLYDGTPVPPDDECHHTSRDIFRVGAATRLVAWKGLLHLLHAASIVIREYPHAEFEIMGNSDPLEPHFRSRLLTEIERLHLGRVVRLRQFSSQPEDFLRSIDCLVNPSFPAEPFGLSIIEAMALGRVVIATVGGGPSEIIDHRECGLLVPPNDPEALASAILELARDPALRRRMARASRERIIGRFEAWSRVAEQENLLRQLATGGR